MKIIKNYILYCLPILFLFAGCAQDKTTVYLAGDSTIAEKLPEKRPETGWGEKLGLYLNKNVTIKNHAKNGRSTKTFLSEGRWQAIMDSVKSGDYVFIQFGHNDQSKNKVDRYTPPADFKKNLARFVDETRAKKANPVLITPVMRRRFDENGKFYDVHEMYPGLVKEVSIEKNVPLLDLHKVSEELFVKLGEEKTVPIFLHLKPGESPNYPEGKEDNTHFNDYGANIIAGLVADLIRDSALGLKNYLVTEKEDK